VKASRTLGNGPSRDPVYVGDLIQRLLDQQWLGQPFNLAPRVIHAPKAERSLPRPTGREAQTQGCQ